MKSPKPELTRGRSDLPGSRQPLHHFVRGLVFNHLAPERAPHHLVRGRAGKGLLVLALALPICAFGAGTSNESLVLWDFEQSITNRWGGRYNIYMREPSWARTYLEPSVHRSLWGHSLRVTVHRESEGFCGVWMKFYPESDQPGQFLDATAYRFLSFWIKGQKGGEDFELELTDKAHEDKEDPALTRQLRTYLPKGVTTQWQEVLIPLSDFWRLDLRRLTKFTLKFAAPGDYRLYLDDLALKSGEAASVPTPDKRSSQAPADLFGEARGRIWVWNTRKLFEDPRQADEIERFFAFCSATRIREIYLSLDFTHPPTESTPQVELRNPEKYRQFLERAHREGQAVEALAGSPEWADRENHPLALAAVEAVLAFNHSSPPSARFDGVHLDVEPYLLMEYADPEVRTDLLIGYLQMISRCVERLRAEHGMRFSCDAPAWFYPVDSHVRQELTVTFRGAAKTVGEHLTDLLDTVTIMDYRNEADGANGIISFGTPALAYAASRGKKIVVGLETSLDPDRTVHFVCGLPVEEFHRRLAGSGLRSKFSFKSFQLSALRTRNDIHVGLVAPSQLDGPTLAAFEKALVSLARQLGAASDPERFPTRPILQAARESLRQDPEWKGVDPFELTDPETQQKIAGFRTTYRMPPKTTFHGLSREVFTEETRSAIEWLSRYPSFDGLAFHFYESFRSLMEAR